MKSIVLCERTLVQESEDFDNLKEDRTNEDCNEKEEEKKKILNGTTESKKRRKSKTLIDNSGKDELSFQNGDQSSSEESSRKEFRLFCENEKSKTAVNSKNKSDANPVTGEKNTLVGFAKNSSCSDSGETDCSARIILSSESDVLEHTDAKNSFPEVQSSNLNVRTNFSIENDDDAIQILETRKSENSSRNAKENSLEINGDEKEEMKENRESVGSLVLDVDENKENEKEGKTILMNDFSESLLVSNHSSECEILVGEVQTISGLEKDSLWSENDLRKSEQDFKGKPVEELLDDCQDMSHEGEKDEESQELGSDDNIVLEGEENLEEQMHIELEESEGGEEKEGEQGLECFYVQKDTEDSQAKEETVVQKARKKSQRKRAILEDNECLSSKKKKLLDEKEVDQAQSEEENAEDSSRSDSLASLEITDVSSKDQFSSESKEESIARKNWSETNEYKLKTSIENQTTNLKKVQATEAVCSVLEKFRGTLKTLTRSDLEELIVQKLCEVITERSNVGELRRKAQALEQDQERWKTKAQSLTKQMREMEMVMKKYMSEVQKQIKEGDTQVVTPLKVTRSVGLQVSFYSSANKGPKTTLSQPGCPNLAQNVNARNAKSQKLPTQFGTPVQNVRSKSTPSLQKGPPPLQKSPVNQLRRPIVPKRDYGSTPANRPVVQQSLLNNNRGVPNQMQTQVQRSSYKQLTATPPQQQQQQNGSKVIDLTEDDDRNTGSTAKSSRSIRVVNHMSQPQPASQNNRFAYLLPTTSASTGTSVGQSRQVLIATPTVPQPNTQIMCSMPPLLFKGGNVVHSGSQSQMGSQSNKVILPKTFGHPAPLPQRPINHNTRPTLKLLPPRPALKISKVQTGIVLSWNMSLSPEHAPIASYQLYAYQESDSPPTTSLWKKVGDVKALPLPMACTLTQFMSGYKYHFAVRAVDLHSRIGLFSFPATIVLV